MNLKSVLIFKTCFKLKKCHLAVLKNDKMGSISTRDFTVINLEDEINIDNYKPFLI